jgi:hypothetical protein
MQVELITGDQSLRAQRGIDSDCLNWEVGDNDGTLACPYEWGNFVMWNPVDNPVDKKPRIQARRLNNWDIERNASGAGNTTDSASLLNHPVYQSQDFHNDPNGVEKNLKFRFAVNGSGKTTGFVNSDFFVLTVNQQAVLYCPEKGSGAPRRLWIFGDPGTNGIPLCRSLGLAGELPKGIIPGITANQP